MAATDDLLAAARDGDGGVDFDGLRVSGDETFAFETPDADYRDLSADDLRAVAADHAEYVSNWRYWEQTVAGHGTHRRAFLRWLEGAPDRDVPDRYDALADGVTRTWGQLALTATLGDDGAREYEVRHVADDDADRDDLDVYDDPLAARELAKYTDDGDYRPLKTAPTLATGWAFAGLSGAALVRTVDFLYPATVANWHLERRGDLDVTHFSETADRQTGIYGMVSELDAAAVAWAAEACCVDSECRKRREWDYDDESDLDVPRGDGEFPCREPCSLLVAAAREFTKIEREDERTYELTLTPSEYEQLQDLVDAVADGRTDEIRDADAGDGANRFRARYLRAKRFADTHGDN